MYRCISYIVLCVELSVCVCVCVCVLRKQYRVCHYSKRLILTWAAKKLLQTISNFMHISLSLPLSLLPLFPMHTRQPNTTISLSLINKRVLPTHSLAHSLTHSPPSAAELFQLTLLISCTISAKLQFMESSPNMNLFTDA